MTEDTKSSSTEHLSVVMTTTPDDDVTQTTGTSDASSSTSGGVEFYFLCGVALIGAVGTIANGLILYALVASKQHKKKFLIFNQNALDFFSSLWLFVSYTLKLCNITVSGLSGYWLCTLVLSGNFVWAGLIGSKVNLVLVTIERYLKVVHSNRSKKWLRDWVIYSAAAFVWISSLAYVQGLAIPTTTVRGGACYSLVKWESYSVQVAYTLCSFLLLYLVPLMIMTYCYGHILVVIRRQARVMAAHNASGSNTGQNQVTQKMHSNVVKTMIIVCAFFALFNLPEEIVFLVMNLSGNVLMDVVAYYSTMFVMFFYVCMNPFVYATKFNPVKRVLLDLIPFKTRSSLVA